MESTRTRASARCIPLDQLASEPPGRIGGKAEGLTRLIAMGLRVPPGFVVVDARPGSLPEDLAARYRALGGKVAVRSSAIGEDGATASFAGQFETYLDVEGEHAVREAIERCLASLASERAAAYRDARAAKAATVMSVIVQRMVDAQAAGVAFTVDPVSGRRDRMVIDAVAGLGDALVSGHATPDHFEVDASGSVVRRELVGQAAVVDDATLARIVRDGRDAARRAGQPLDLEWAVDAAGTLHWLQARPITELPADPRELDTRPDSADVYTKANIGEMMPSAVTPLTLSVTARGIDMGLQLMYHGVGVGPEPRPEAQIFVASYANHLFLNLTRLSDLGRHIFGAPPDHMALAVCGRPVPELVRGEMASIPVRIVTSARYFRMLASVSKARARLEALVASHVVPKLDDPVAQWRAIDAGLPDLYLAYRLHLESSAGAGAFAPALLGVVARGREPTEADHARVGELLSGATDVESADIAAGIDRVAEAIARHPFAREFARASTDGALEFLSSAAAWEAGGEFAAYLAKHGHRAVREAELRQTEWREDPTPVVRSLQANVAARQRGVARSAARPGVHLATLSRPLRALVRLGHAAVRSRERTKSLLIELTARFKGAYRHLAALLVARRALPDPDLVYFFTHQELAAFCAAPDRHAVERAEARRRVLPYQAGLVFDEVFQGVPEPLAPEAARPGEALRLVGKPVSPGIARGLARVARTIEDAAAVQPGEILISPITDVGWTPYFGVLAGLATDIGSAVSHGAVVAREYGLPAVVNLRVATQRFRTGDRVVLDGTRGTLSLEGEEA